MHNENKSGYEREAMFWELLQRFQKNTPRLIWEQEKDIHPFTYDDVYIKHCNWLSQQSKESEFDFNVRLNGGLWPFWVFIDVVGEYQTKDGIKLITAHKSWSAKLKSLQTVWNWSKEDAKDMAYLAWSPGNTGETWCLLKIHNQLPLGDILLTPARRRKILDLYDVLAGGYCDICTELKGADESDYSPEDFALYDECCGSRIIKSPTVTPTATPVSSLPILQPEAPQAPPDISEVFPVALTKIARPVIENVTENCTISRNLPNLHTYKKDNPVDEYSAMLREMMRDRR